MLKSLTAQDSHLKDELLHSIHEIGSALEHLKKDYDLLLANIGDHQVQEEEQMECEPALFPEMERDNQEHFIIIMDNDPAFFPMAVDILSADGNT